eukprot:SAG31_NODE_26500_length_441_cov_0.824561_1_plen_49_part_01
MGRVHSVPLAKKQALTRPSAWTAVKGRPVLVASVAGAQMAGIQLTTDSL